MGDALRETGDRLYQAAGITVDHHEASIAGLHTHWVSAGDSTQPDAVLLHGSGGSAALWYAAIGDLARRRHVIAVDLPGHGETAIPGWRSPDAMERTLDWLAAFLADLDSPMLVGHSLGGYLSLIHFVRRRPPMAGMVLIDSGGLGPKPPGFVLATKHPVLGMVLGIAAGQRPTRARIERTVRAMTVDPLRIPHGKLALDYTVAAASRAGAGRFQFELYRSVAMHEGEPGYKVWGSLDQVSIPTLMVWGERDYFPLRFAEQAVREMPAATLHVLPDTGHLSYLEDAAGFNRALDEWLEETYEK